MSDIHSANALSVLSQHGKSFRFAGMFLTREQLLLAARLYQFCRYVDDIGDLSPYAATANRQLMDLRDALQKKDKHFSYELDDFLQLQQTLKLPTTWPVALIDGVIQDTEGLVINDCDDLLRYAYRVAGVVGLMMCPILNANQRGIAHAIDLGVGMQLTNIARDVMEDANIGRKYIPNSWTPITASQIAIDDPANRPEISAAIKRLLLLAERYYASGTMGLRFLPGRGRIAIAIAARVYRQIGIALLEKECAYWQGRTVVGTTKKIQIAMAVIARPLITSATDPIDDTLHDSTLHNSFSDLYSPS